MSKKFKIPNRRTTGKNPRLKNSLITLGAHGGIQYKFYGAKDSWGMHKHPRTKVYSSNNAEEWAEYLKEHPKVARHKRRWIIE
ncbi:hypothetical protein FOL77_08635 [Lactobacillus reuteri]|uniref:hypothetical protein n=1 Tax=Limosilactobacillus reuteri TaxID=1598 RepID=UPI00146B974D|nr:hypothetical protein [Limosilactobacillus reuteri]NMV49676.1 hypothetical protein [Limosilactobacillus reuteri]NMV51356.1 hypothetical protein [Limosilactobacillus reuteri]